MRSIAVTIFFLGLCIGLAAALGAVYVALALLAATLALTSGLYLVLALAVGVVWPVLVVAYVTYVTNNISRAQALHAASTSSKLGLAHTALPRVEDAKEREC